MSENICVLILVPKEYIDKLFHIQWLAFSTDKLFTISLSLHHRPHHKSDHIICALTCNTYL